MKRVLTALVLIPIVLLVVFKAPDWLMACVVGLFGLAASWEFTQLVPNPGVTLKRVALVCVALFFLGIVGLLCPNGGGYLSGLTIAAISCAAAAPFILLIFAMREDDLRQGFLAAASLYFAFPYIALPLSSLLVLRTLQPGTEWFFFLLLFLVVWSGDIFAFYVGRSVGRHKMAPRISPGKSWEGAIASVVGATLVALILVQFSGLIQQTLASMNLVPAPTGSDDPSSGIPQLRPAPILLTIMIAIALNAVAQLGDLAESMIKRAVDAKDSGTLFPGHGGVLDRIDALLFAAPLAAILFPSLQRYFFTKGPTWLFIP